MKKNLHPQAHELHVSCACGQKHSFESTLTTVALDICSNCHPFFTGQQKFIDRAGRIEKFQRRFQPKNAA